MTDESLERFVRQALLWDHDVDGRAIALAVRRGVVTLRGTVGSDREKLAAERAVITVHGVRCLHNDLDVRALHGFARDDARIRGAVLQAIMQQRGCPLTIDADVYEGIVTLTGHADSADLVSEATITAAEVPGVQSVHDRIRVSKLTSQALPGA